MTAETTIRKTWMICQMLHILERDGGFLAVVIPYELGQRYDIRFPITAQQEQVLRPYLEDRRHVCIPVAIKQTDRGGFFHGVIALTVLDSHPIYEAKVNARICYVTPFFDCEHPWTK